MPEQYRSKKYHDISELADETTKKIASSEKEWTKYLDTAGRMFRFPFHAQVLIYAQRPDAAACATMEQWNQGMGCWVNRGSKGIALIDRTSPRPKLTYVFDVSNVHKAKYIGKDPYLWELREEHKETVTAQLEKIGGETDANMPFESRIMELADRMAQEHMEELMKQADAVKSGSFLGNLDHHAVCIRMQETLSSSIAYTILSRCGADMDVWKEHLKFQYIRDFNTVDTLSIIGNATTQICKPILIEIEKAIAAYDRRKEKNREKQKETGHRGNEEKKEKSLANTKNLVYNVSNNDTWKTKQAETPRQEIEREETAYGTDIRKERGLPDPKSDHAAGTGGRTDEIRTDARKIPEGAYGRGLRGNDPERDADTASAAGSGAGRAEDGSAGGTDGQRAGGKRETESRRSNEMGADDEQYPSFSRGDRTGGIDLQPVDADEDIQHNMEMQEPDNGADSLSGFSSYFGRYAGKEQELQKAVLCSDRFLIHKRPEIAGYFAAEKDTVLQAEYLKNCFHMGMHYIETIENLSVAFHAEEKGIYMNLDGHIGKTETFLSWEDARFFVQSYMEDGAYLQPGETAEKIDVRGKYEQLDLFTMFPEQLGSMVMKQAEQGSVQAGKNSAVQKLSAIPKEQLDTILRSGGGRDNGRKRIYAKYRQGKTPEEMAEFLKKEYGTTGKGFEFDGKQVSVWFDEEGMTVGSGTSAWENPEFTMNWQEIETEIRLQVESGAYMGANEAYLVDEAERGRIADHLYFFFRDGMGEMPEELGLETANYPDSHARLAELLSTPEGIDLAASYMDKALAQLEGGEKKLRFHSVMPKEELREELDNLLLEKKTFPAADYVEVKNEDFITQDEIDHRLGRGSGVQYSSFRIYDYFMEGHGSKETADFLKHEYGTGGCSHALAGADHSWEDHDFKGIRLRKGSLLEPYADVLLSWKTVEKRIRKLIQEDKYLSPKGKEAFAEYKEEQARQELKRAQEQMERDTKVSCKDAIDRAIAEHFDGYRLPKGTAEGVIKEYGAERVSYVLANSVMHRRQEGRISAENKEWAESIEPYVMYESRDIVVSSHPAILNGFINQARRYIEHEKEPAAQEETEQAVEQDVPDMDAGEDHALELMDVEEVEKVMVALESSEDFAEPGIGFYTHQYADGREGVRYRLVTTGEDGLLVPYPDHNRFFINRELAQEYIDRHVDVIDVIGYDEMAVQSMQKQNGYKREQAQTEDDLSGLDAAAVHEKPGNGEVDQDVEAMPAFAEKAAKENEVGQETSRQETAEWAHVERAEAGAGMDTSGHHVQKSEPEPKTEQPVTTEPTIYPGDKNGLPYDIVIEKMHFGEPEQAEPKKAAQPDQSNAINFRITDDALGIGSAKEKFRKNIEAIRTLEKIERENRTATPEEQKVLSQYVGWGGLADAFDGSKSAWVGEYQELKSLLSDAEYASARESTLNAHYTSPIIIRSIYEALDKMGFTKGNILEPAMGIGNFYGCLPEKMQESKLYGVELDGLTGRIAKQLYPKADIKISGFEKTDYPNDFFDVAIGNVPFGQYKVSDRQYDKHNFLIHDYFFAKSLDKVRPGGVVAFVTSKGTMDKKSPEVRKYLAQRAELLGAVRLPNTAFKENAGTEVTSDILFLKKRDRVMDLEPDWVYLSENENGIAMNSYFVEHPEMIVGKMEKVSGPYGMESTCQPDAARPFSEQLAEAVSRINGEIEEAELEELESEAADQTIPADPDVKNYSFTLVDDKVYYRENSVMKPVDMKDSMLERIKGMVEIRDCTQELIHVQLEEYPETVIKEKQAQLNSLYDVFSKKYGLINSQTNKRAFNQDSSYCLLCSLEKTDEEGKFIGKADMFTKRTIKKAEAVTSVDTAAEALAVSLSEKAKVDLGYMAELSGKSTDKIKEELAGVIFNNPVTDKWETADEYLSGNVRDKLKTAKVYAENHPEYNVNVQALTQVQPKELDASEIEVRIGATWIKPEYMEDFMRDTFQTPQHLFDRKAMGIQYSDVTGLWNIKGKNADYGNSLVSMAYGTSRRNAYQILEDSLNLKDSRIYDTIEEDGKSKRILNKKETTLAAQKQDAIREAFKDWVFRDADRRQDLVEKYNKLFNSTRPREYDGSHLKFPGMTPDIELKPHQKNAVAHVLYGNNTLLAHCVGAGKTFEMTAAAMESRRLGLCQKSLFVVPNHLTEQWASDFLRLYPGANILAATKKDFEPANRKKFCSRIATGDYDAVIIGHSQFEKIPLSIERQEAMIERQISEIELAIEQAKADNGERYTIKQMEKTRKSLLARLEKLNDTSRKDNVVTFEQLGVDRLFVDESHNYKNLFLYTKMRNVAGIAQTEAQKSSDMFAKCQYLDEITGGKGVTFATGTPISNSMTELYTNMRYLQYDTLQKLGLGHFDSWASSFGETQTAIELAPEGTGYRAKTRFAKFFNLPELIALFKECADIQTPDMLKLPVPEAEYENVVLKPSEYQKDMVSSLADRAEDVRNRLVEPRQDNMLKITNDGRKLALDQRLINDMLPDAENSKASTCVGKAFEIWEQTKEQKSTQLIFCDLSTPKGDGAFNVYEDIKNKLVKKGVPPEEIAFIHDANTETRKAELFGKVRSGQVRFLLGSTQKMGAGTNVQDRLIALHHLDVPWVRLEVA